MAAYVNQSGGMLILPDGTEIKAGESAEITAEVSENVGVKQFIDGDMLVAEKRDRKAKPDDK